MEQIGRGFFLSISAAQEMLRLRAAYWQVIAPWSFIYMGFSFIYSFRYPQGAPGWLLPVLWNGLLLGLSFLMAWNWANALTGQRGRIDLSNGWDDSQVYDYASGLFIAGFVIPILVSFSVGIPLIILLMLFLSDQHQITAVMTSVMVGVVVYINARLLPISAALVSRMVSPLPQVWKQSESSQSLLVAALMTVLISNVLINIVIGLLAGVLDQLGLPRADILVLPLVFAAFFFIVGWLTLLSQRIFTQLARGGMAILDELTDIVSVLLGYLPALLRVTAIWYALAVIGQLLTGTPDLSTGQLDLSKTGSLAYAGLLLHVVALLLGWYSLHRYLINPVDPAPWLPDALGGTTPLRFIGGQLRNMAVLFFIAMGVIIPMTIFYAPDALEMGPEDAQALNHKISLVALPLFVLFFSRLLLVAPLTARGEEKAVKRSMAATKGHFIRINLLQLFCLLPLGVSSLLAGPVEHFSQSMIALALSSVITIAGTLVSLAMYTQLAETEYKHLMN